MSALVGSGRTRGADGLRRAVLLSSAGTAAARFAGAVGGLVAARLLGPAGRGQLAVLVLFATAGSLAASAGVQFWVARRVAQTQGLRAVRAVVRVHVLVMVCATALVAAAVGWAIGHLAGVGADSVAAAAAFSASAAVSLVLLALPNGLRRMGVVAVATATAATLYAATTVALLALDRPSITLVLLGGTAGNLAAIAIVSWWTVGFGSGARPCARDANATEVAPERGAYRRALGFGIPAGISELLLFAMLRVDVLIVACVLPMRSVGLYAVAVALTEVLWVVPDGIAQVVLPTTARDPSGSRTIRLLAIGSVVTLLGGMTLVALDAWVLERFFGSRFQGAAVAVPLLVLASLAGGAWKIVGAEIAALGRTGPRATSALAGLLTMVAVDAVTVPSMGIRGAALGSAVGYAAAAAVVTRAWVVTRAARSSASPGSLPDLACAGPAPARTAEVRA
ncbi:MAG: hypothetical protein AMXMBFR46_15820 [Acidimicrobiia bacterium]